MLPLQRGIAARSLFVPESDADEFLLYSSGIPHKIMSVQIRLLDLSLVL